MLTRASLILCLGVMGMGSPCYAHDHELISLNQSQQKTDIKQTLRLELSPVMTFIPGQKVLMKLRLLQNDKVLSFKDLKEVHTEKLHLLVIDPSLSDYHHIHPQEVNKAGEFVFEFTPNKSGVYRVWADVTPLATNQQVYVWADMGTAAPRYSPVDKKVKNVSVVDGYTFSLTLDAEPREGQAVMGAIKVTKEGKPFTQLEPLMGAFAHVVGFGEDNHSVLHIHPMGKEPTKNSDRGGPVLSFHIEPEKAGFVSLFVQVRIDGKELVVPFGLFVKAK